MMLALYVAFWLQLESASSAAVSVAILAQPKRGQAISKAIYRYLGTILGGVVSIVFAAAFGQDQVLMLVCFTTWLSLCVFVAQYLQDTRAYGAILSGYTVAIIAISNIDTPQSVFDAAVSRVAAIAVAITAITFINDALATPSTWRGLPPPLVGALRSAKAFARHAFATAMHDIRTALAGGGGDAVDRTSLHCDRIFQFAQVNHGPEVVRTRRMKLAFAIAHPEASAARAHDQLRVFDRDPFSREAALRARHALARGTSGDIEAAAQRFLRFGREAGALQHLAVARAVSDLVAVTRIMARHRRFLQTVLVPVG